MNKVIAATDSCEPEMKSGEGSVGSSVLNGLVELREFCVSQCRIVVLSRACVTTGVPAGD